MSKSTVHLQRHKKGSIMFKSIIDASSDTSAILLKFGLKSKYKRCIRFMTSLVKAAPHSARSYLLFWGELFPR